MLVEEGRECTDASGDYSVDKLMKGNIKGCLMRRLTINELLVSVGDAGREKETRQSC